MLELPEGAAAGGGDDDDDEDVEIDDTPAYSGGASFNKLAHAVRADNDPFSDVQADVRQLFAVRLGELSKTHPGKVQELVQGMPADAQALIAKYLSAAGVALA